MDSLMEELLRGFSELLDAPGARGLMADDLWSNLEVPELVKSLGFTLVNDNTWLPTPLIVDRECQRRQMARKDQSSVIWTR